MAVYERFEDLPVWQEAAHLYNLALDLLQAHNVFVSVLDGGSNLSEQRSPSPAILRRDLSGSHRANSKASSQLPEDPQARLGQWWGSSFADPKSDRT
jgi:hypothetical protein